MGLVEHGEHQEVAQRAADKGDDTEVPMPYFYF